MSRRKPTPVPQHAAADKYVHWWTCADCGKRSYPDRRTAKAVIKGHGPTIRGRKVRPYRCGDGWHIGHLADPIVHGEATRDDIYRGAA